MAVKIIQVSNECKNNLSVKWLYKKLSCQMGEKIFQERNWRKNILRVKWQ